MSVNFDAEALDLVRKRLAQAFERPLRGVVHAYVGEGADSADRRDLQDVTSSLLAQDRQRGLGHPKSAKRSWSQTAPVPLAR
jgi:hypothetical protein